MVDLKKARKIARFVRISEDKPSKNFDFSDLKSRDDVKDTMLRHGVLISKSVTPSLKINLIPYAKPCIYRENAFLHLYITIPKFRQIALLICQIHVFSDSHQV